MCERWVTKFDRFTRHWRYNNSKNSTALAQREIVRHLVESYFLTQSLLGNRVSWRLSTFECWFTSQTEACFTPDSQRWTEWAKTKKKIWSLWSIWNTNVWPRSKLSPTTRPKWVWKGRRPLSECGLPSTILQPPSHIFTEVFRLALLSWTFQECLVMISERSHGNSLWLPFQTAAGTVTALYKGKTTVLVLSPLFPW